MKKRDHVTLMYHELLLQSNICKKYIFVWIFLTNIEMFQKVAHLKNLKKREIPTIRWTISTPNALCLLPFFLQNP